MTTNDKLSDFRWADAFWIIVTAWLTGCAQPATSTNNPFAQPSPNFSNPWNTPPALPPPANTPGVPPPPGIPYTGPGITSTPTVAPTNRRGRPNWSNPGSLLQQRARAVRFDPFADNQAGPEVVGGRPLSYLKQQPEAVRATEFLNPLSPF